MLTTLPPFHKYREKPGFDVKLASKISVTVKERFSLQCVLFLKVDVNFMMAQDRKPFRITEHASGGRS